MPTDQQIDELKAQAQHASQRAYCNYSNFHVGAAVLASSGKVYSGCNIENASYGLTICAERTAIINAVSSGERRIQAVAVYTPTDKPTALCGACRQVINEFGPDALVIMFCDGTDQIQVRLEELLPSAFSPENLQDS